MFYKVVLVLLMLLTNRTSAWAETYGLPFRFELNQGQADPSVKYVAHAAGFTAHLNESTVTLKLRHAISMRFAGAGPNIRITPEDEMALRTHYYRGERSQWHTDIKNYQRLVYRDVYPGIDAVFRGNGGVLEFDFVVHSGSNPGSIALDFTGQQEATIADDGDLRLTTQDGEVRVHARRIYAQSGNEQSEVAGRFVKRNGTFGVQVADYDRFDLLVIDPVITFSTYVQVRGGNE